MGDDYFFLIFHMKKGMYQYMNINSDLNTAREAISMVDDMSFICRHIVSSVICEIDGKGQTILDYTTTQEASNFSIFQESVMLEHYDDDNRIIYDMDEIPYERYVPYTDLKLFEEAYMSIYQEAAAKRKPISSFPDDPRDIPVGFKECMYKGYDASHKLIAGLLVRTFIASHDAHNNGRGDDIKINLDQSNKFVQKTNNKINHNLKNQKDHVDHNRKIHGINAVIEIIDKMDPNHEIFSYKIARDYQDNKRQTRQYTGGPGKAVLITVYIDCKLPIGIVTEEQARAMKAYTYVTRMESKLNKLLSNQHESDQDSVSRLKRMIPIYRKFIYKTLKVSNDKAVENKIDDIRTKGCLDSYNNTMVKQLSFHLPLYTTKSAKNLNNTESLSILTNLERIGVTAPSKKAFLTGEWTGEQTAKFIADLYKIPRTESV